MKEIQLKEFPFKNKVNVDGDEYNLISIEEDDGEIFLSIQNDSGEHGNAEIGEISEKLGGPEFDFAEGWRPLLVERLDYIRAFNQRDSSQENNNLSGFVSEGYLYNLNTDYMTGETYLAKVKIKS